MVAVCGAPPHAPVTQDMWVLVLVLVLVEGLVEGLSPGPWLEGPDWGEVHYHYSR